jgi:hypothetical protein
MGRDGVAKHFNALAKQRAYFRCTRFDGEVRSLQHYFIPHPQSATVSRIDERRRRKA